MRIDNEINFVPLALSDRLSKDRKFRDVGVGSSSVLGFGSVVSPFDVEIETTSIDLYCSDNAISSIYYVKCDAEGHDFYVIMGAQRMLGAGRIGFFQFEYNHRWISTGRTLFEVFRFAKSIGYNLAKLSRDGIVIIREWNHELENYIEENYIMYRTDPLLHDMKKVVLQGWSSYNTPIYSKFNFS